MNILVAAVVTLCFLSGILLRYYPFASLLEERDRRLLRNIYAAGLVTNFLVMSAVFSVIPMNFDAVRVDWLVFTLALLTVNALVIRGRGREHLFVYGIVLTCNYLLSAIPTFLNAKSGFPENPVDRGPGLIVYVVLLFVTYLPMRKLLKITVEPFLTMDSGDYWGTVWFVPVAMFLAMYFICPGGEHNGTVNHLISSGLIGTATILMCWSISADHKRLKEREDILDQLNMQKTHYAQMEQQVMDARKTAHDFKHHISAIQHFIDTDDKEGLQAYCWELGNRPVSGVRIPYTGNNAVDGVMYRYAQLAKENQIRFEYIGNIGKCAMSDMDLAVLLGNALDNAFTGCMKLEEKNREIRVIMQTEQHMVSVVVHNTFDGIVQRKNNVFYSRKRRNEPGIGMSSMHTVCEQNGAGMDVKWDDNSFTVLFMIPAKKED